MARKARETEETAVVVEDIQAAENAGMFEGDDSAMMEEHSKIVEMLSAFRGTDSEAQAYLYRIDNTRGKMRGRFLSVYPVDVSIDVIYDDAQRKWKGGDFSLVIRDGSGMRRRQNFSVEPLPTDGTVVEVDNGENMGKRLDRMIEVAEKTTLLDRASRMMNPPAPERNVGMDQNTMMFLEMFRESQKTNALLMQTIMSGQSKQSTPASDMIELIRLGADLKEGRLPGSDDDDSMSGMLGKFAPVIAAVLGGAQTQAQPQPQPTRAALPPAQPILAQTPKPQPTTEEVITRRVVDEIVFMSSFPLEADETKRNDRLDHVLNYIEAYTPDILRQAAGIDATTFLSMIQPLHPALSDRGEFLTALHARNKVQFATADADDWEAVAKQ